jgi:hypothetical protein
VNYEETKYIAPRLFRLDAHDPALNSGVGLAAEELAAAGTAYELTGVDDWFSAGENCLGNAFDLNAFEHGIVDAHVVRLGTDHLLFVGIENDQVGVGTYGNRAFAGEQAEEFSGCGGDDFDEAIWRETFAVDAAGVDEA